MADRQLPSQHRGVPLVDEHPLHAQRQRSDHVVVAVLRLTDDLDHRTGLHRHPTALDANGIAGTNVVPETEQTG